MHECLLMHECLCCADHVSKNLMGRRTAHINFSAGEFHTTLGTADNNLDLVQRSSMNTVPHIGTASREQTRSDIHALLDSYLGAELRFCNKYKCAFLAVGIYHRNLP